MILSDNELFSCGAAIITVMVDEVQINTLVALPKQVLFLEKANAKL